MTIIQWTYRVTIATALLATTSTIPAQANPNVSDITGPNVSDVTGPNVSDVTGPNVSDITGTDTASERARQAGLSASDVDQLAEDIGTAYASCTAAADCTTFYTLLNQAQTILQPE